MRDLIERVPQAEFGANWWTTAIPGAIQNVSRRPLADMNPLSVDDVTNVEVAFRKWVKQLRAVENLIP